MGKHKQRNPLKQGGDDAIIVNVLKEDGKPWGVAQLWGSKPLVPGEIRAGFKDVPEGLMLLDLEILSHEEYLRRLCVGA
jgi:hypothetical protein